MTDGSRGRAPRVDGESAVQVVVTGREVKALKALRIEAGFDEATMPVNVKRP